MATGRAKKPCVKCDKGAGITICGGCEEWFCAKHFTEHRQGLGEKMDHVGQQHDFLQNKLTETNVTHSFHSHINEWETASIKKIQEVAKKARTDLEKYLNETKTELRESLGKIKNELASSHQSGNYTEIELKEWTDELNKLRQLLEKPSTIDIVEDSQSQPLIRVVQQKSLLSTIVADEWKSPSKKQEFAEPGAYKPLPCKGRHCTNCGKCRDWYYTGDLQTWQWIRNFKNWKDDDLKRWRSGDYHKRFQCRDGYTCTYGGGGPIIYSSGHPHISYIFIGSGGGSTIYFSSCLCEDNRRV
ncbi:unnamed protein product [Rotaria sordida]|uniref:Uncharacterized protein n=1 Tax=Rotaria sordida TaxID=392033 RepID=A0A814V602_9BILA|nr:unnamed protein product [Rotaria sordida]